MQSDVAIFNIVIYPRAWLAISGDGTALPDDLGEILIVSNPVFVIVKIGIHTFGYSDPFRKNDIPRLRTPPYNRLIVVIPGKDAIMVGHQERVGIQRAAQTKDAAVKNSIRMREKIYTLAYKMHSLKKKVDAAKGRST